MAEILGVVASSVAMIGLAANVVRLGYRFHEYVGDIRRAPKDIQKLMNELHSLTPVLVALRDYAVANQGSAGLQALTIAGGPLEECTQELRDLEQKLTPRKGWKGRKDALLWPLKESETLRHISVIERQKTIFSLTLTIDHITLSKVIEGYAQRTWDVVQDIEIYVQDTHATVQTIEASIRQTNEVAKEILEETTTQNTENKAHIDGQKRDAILNWLFADDFNKRHVEIKTRRQKDTGEWLLKKPGFQDWGSGKSNSRLLWGSGIPGAGKTFLSSVVIDHFQAQKRKNNYGIAHVYFDYKEQEGQSPIRVLSSLVKQLATQLSILPTRIIGWYEERHKGILTIEELYSGFLEISKHFPQVFLVLDALDECHPENQRGPLLPIFQQMGNDGINVFLTSRPHPEDIQDALRDAVRIKLSAQQDDLRIYITKRIEENPRARRLVKQAKCKDRIISELTNCAKGMFLLVHFHVDYICQQTNAKQVLAALQELKNTPGGSKRPLDPTYERAMESIKGQDKSLMNLAYTILSWLVKAKRILTAEELRVAVAIEQNRYEIDDMDLPDRMTLMDACAGLVAIDESSDTVKLAHYTVQEYLIENSILPIDAGFRLAMACTTYLSFNSLDGPCIFDTSLRDRFKSHPFLDYVSKSIPAHLQDCDEHLTTGILFKLLQSSGNIESYCQARRYRPKSNYPAWHKCNGGCPPLYVASSFAHLAVIGLLLEQGVEVSVGKKGGKTALHVASKYGYKAVVNLLLKKGANVSATNKNGQTPLYDAIEYGHEEIVNLLLEKGADPSVIDTYGQTPLHIAARAGNEAAASLLLEKGADISAINKWRETPLQLAAHTGNGAVVNLLLEKGADTSAINIYGQTPLHIAARDGNEVVVNLLLEKGADTSAINKWRETPLHLAAHTGNGAVVNLLLEKGADTSATGKYGQAPLHIAARSGNEVVVNLLLEKGADTSAINIYGQTPLHHAARNNNRAVTNLLIEKGADASAIDSFGQTPLHIAARKGHEAVANLLLEKGADILSKTNYESTPLHLAAIGGDEGIVQLLLSKGVDISARDKDGDTPLHEAALHGHTSIAGILVKEGSDVSATGKVGMTPLHWAASRGCEGVVNLLLTSGASILSVDSSGCTPLHHVICEEFDDKYWQLKDGWREAMVDLLLKNGADTTIRDKKGRTPLHWAAFKGYEKTLVLLLKDYVSISTVDNEGNTSLHLAASGGHEAVVGPLLENGANISALNHSGQTALQIATIRGYKKRKIKDTEIGAIQPLYQN